MSLFCIIFKIFSWPNFDQIKSVLWINHLEILDSIATKFGQNLEKLYFTTTMFVLAYVCAILSNLITIE